MTKIIDRHPADPRWFALINDQVKIVPRQILPVSLFRELATVPDDHVVVRDHNSNQDELVEDHAQVDLAQGNVFFSRRREACEPVSICGAAAKMALSVDDRFEIIQVDKLSLQAVRQLFNLSEDSIVFRDFESPNDQLLEAGVGIAFVDGPVFYTRMPIEAEEVTITINNTQYLVKSGQMTAVQLKEMGSVIVADELVQIVDGEIMALEDDGFVCIRGGETFVSHPRQGGAS